MLEIDSSDSIKSMRLSHLYKNKLLYFVAFFSKNFNFPKCNENINDK